jgi:hypothetical protein
MTAIKRVASATAACALVALTLTSAAHAWGSDGHQAVAGLAGI